MLHVGDVEAACGHVGGDQNLDLARLERLDRAIALTLALVAMDRAGGIARLFQRFHQLLAAVLGAAEDQRQLVAVLVQEFDQQVGLFGLGDEMHQLRDLVRDLASRADLDPHRIVQIGRGDFRHLLVHRGREKHRLALLGQQACDLAQGVDETQIQHLIRLVQHQKAGGIQTHGATVQQVQQTARCRHQNIRAPDQTPGLRRDRLPADDEVHLHRRALDQRGQRIGDLLGQFARGGQDQAMHMLFHRPLGISHQLRQQRQAKSRRLAGAGLGQPHHILAVQRMGNGPALDRGGFGDACFLEAFHQCGRKAHHFKFVQRHILHRHADAPSCQCAASRQGTPVVAQGS